MLAPISAWIAIRGQIVSEHSVDLLPAIVLGVAVLLWVAGFDMIYACQDAQFDRQTGLHSIPARWGVAAALRLAALCHAGMLVAAVAAASGLSAVGLDLSGRHRWPWPHCWFTSIVWSGRMTCNG